ncbi:hypothetical protein KSZ39_12940, partial [Phocaeicola dorei]|uniref:hypothetical protein n=1 Tax=Phocaeicola dorei TaxID=357276 RepID=UPI001C37EE83
LIFCKFTLLEPYKQLYYNILIYRTPLKYYNYELQYVAEPGAFDLMIGTDSQHVKTATFVLH